MNVQTVRPPTFSLTNEQLGAKHLVYAAWIREHCIYVGMSSAGLYRPFGNPVLEDRRKKITKIDIFLCGSRRKALILEQSLTTELQPTFSIVTGMCARRRRNLRRLTPWKHMCSKACQGNALGHQTRYYRRSPCLTTFQN